MGVQLLGGHPIPKEIKYLFIDAGCLRQMVDVAATRYPPFSLSSLDFTKLVAGYRKTFYYDAPPPPPSSETAVTHPKRLADQDALFDELRSIRGLHVYEGDSRRRKKRVEQKKVDVMIAVDMLTHAFRRNMHHATLLTADLDFKPLLDALVQDGMHVELWYPHGKPNKELVASADSRRPLTFRDLLEWSTDTYRRDHPPPKRISKPGKDVADWEIVDEWPTEIGTTAEVYRTPSPFTYTAVFPSMHNRDKDYYSYVSHRDRAYLRSYVHECCREFWKTPI